MAWEILRDQEKIPAVMWNRALPIDGGTYTITARAPGTSDWLTRVTLDAEAHIKTIDIPDLRTLRRDLEARTTPPQLQPQPPQEREREPPKKTEQRGIALPIIVGAGAVALLGGALGFSRWGDSRYEEAKAETTDQSRRSSLYDSANRRRYIAQGLAAAGVGCAAVAVWLYVRRRGGRTEPASVRAGQLMLAPTTSGIGMVGRF